MGSTNHTFFFEIHLQLTNIPKININEMEFTILLGVFGIDDSRIMTGQWYRNHAEAVFALGWQEGKPAG